MIERIQYVSIQIIIQIMVANDPKLKKKIVWIILIGSKLKFLQNL